MGWEVSQLQMGANNNEEVKKTVKKANEPYVININGNNNVVYINDNKKVSSGGGKSILAFVIAFLAIAAIALVILHCCPDVFADFVRLVISMALDS